MTLLHAKNLSHTYENTLFENIDITLDSQKSCAIVGVSGSGKSTILHVLSTLLKPQTGSVSLFSEDIYQLNDNKLLNIRRKDVGIIFQFHYLFKGFTAFENIEIATLLAEEEIDDTYIDKLHIRDVLKQNIGELSGGQQQRVSIARVLSKKPKIIFADEPTGNLDQSTANDVMETIFEYIHTHDAALFLVTHDENLAKKCDNAYELKDKKLIALN